LEGHSNSSLFDLSVDIFGNYVIQKLITFLKGSITDRILNLFKGKIY